MPRTRRAITSILAIALAVVAPAVGSAQGTRPMTLVDLLNTPSLTDPQLSPDGRTLLYRLSTSDWAANRQVSHVWRINVDGTHPIQMTNGDDGEQSPRWSPDGRLIAFLAARGAEATNQIHLMRVDGGEARQLTHHATPVSRITWSPDGAFIYFVASDDKSDEEKSRDRAKDDVFAFDDNFAQRHLWRMTLADGKETRLTEGAYTVAAYSLSRDGEQIAMQRAPNPLFGYSDRSEVWVMDLLDRHPPMQLTHNRAVESGPVLSPDNSQVLFLSDSNDDFEPYYNDKIFLTDARGQGPARRLLPDFPYEVQNASWSGDGRSIYFVANMGLHTELFRLELGSGQLEQLTSGEHSLRGWSYHPQLDTHVFGIDERTNPGDVWLLADDGSSPTQITRVFSYLVEDFSLPRQERIDWQSTDGVTVEGLVFFPLDYREGRRYPLVVQTHGGPASSDRFGFQSWRDYIPVLAAKGYVVFQPNYRGSTGYGDDFLRDMVGHYFQNSHLDVMSGVDHLIDIGLADGERMVKMGWSAGGHMTNKIITFTDRFKAASSGAGAVNWISMYAESDTRRYRTPWFGGTPWERDAPIDVYWQHSPLKDIWKVKTPTLILVGQNDPRVPMPQSVELYRALKTNGVPTKLYVAPRELHGWRELRHRLFKMNVELDWFERYATDREYVWETAPGSADAVMTGETTTGR